MNNTIKANDKTWVLGSQVFYENGAITPYPKTKDAKPCGFATGVQK